MLSMWAIDHYLALYYYKNIQMETYTVEAPNLRHNFPDYCPACIENQGDM